MPVLRMEPRVSCKLSKHSYCDTSLATWFSFLTRKAEVFDPFTHQETAPWKHMHLSQPSASRASCWHTCPECLGFQPSYSLTPEYIWWQQNLRVRKALATQMLTVTVMASTWRCSEGYMRSALAQPPGHVVLWVHERLHVALDTVTVFSQLV